jgi:hypothetical protein
MPFSPPAFFAGACTALVWIVFQDSIKNGVNFMTASVLSFPFLAVFWASTRALDLSALTLIVVLTAGAGAVPKDDDNEVDFSGTFYIKDIVEQTTAIQMVTPAAHDHSESDVTLINEYDVERNPVATKKAVRIPPTLVAHTTSVPRLASRSAPALMGARSTVFTLRSDTLAHQLIEPVPIPKDGLLVMAKPASILVTREPVEIPVSETLRGLLTKQDVVTDKVSTHAPLCTCSPPVTRPTSKSVAESASVRQSPGPVPAPTSFAPVDSEPALVARNPSQVLTPASTKVLSVITSHRGTATNKDVDYSTDVGDKKNRSSLGLRSKLRASVKRLSASLPSGRIVTVSAAGSVNHLGC